MYKHLIWFSVYIYMLNWGEFALTQGLKDLHLSASTSKMLQIHSQLWILTSLSETPVKKLNKSPASPTGAS